MAKKTKSTLKTFNGGGCLGTGIPKKKKQFMPEGLIDPGTLGECGKTACEILKERKELDNAPQQESEVEKEITKRTEWTPPMGEPPESV